MMVSIVCFNISEEVVTMSKQSILKRAVTVLIVPFMMFAMITAPAGLLGAFGSQKVSAADPHGNWNQQYDKTRQEAINNCLGNQGSYGTCYRVSYLTSDSYGANSRVFQWEEVWALKVCHLSVYIGNNNGIFASRWSYCSIVT